MPDALTSYLLNRTAEPPTLEVIRAAHLEGYVYAQLPSGHALKAQLRPAVTRATARHGLIRHALSALITAWNQAGVEPLVVKGFALAEFTYAHPSMRYYGDVDIVLSRADARRATSIAVSLGWLENDNQDDEPLGYDHEYSHLYSPDRAVRIDLHLEVLQGDRPSVKRQGFTNAIIAAAVPQTLAGARLRVPQAADQIIVGLMNRRWGDRWGRKPSDLLDLRAIAAHHELSCDAVLARGAELGCAPTLRLTLESCDPWLNRLELRQPSRLEQIKLDWQCRKDLGSYEADYYLERLIQAPMRIVYVLRTLPVLQQAIQARDSGGDIHALIAAFDAPPKTSIQPTQGKRIRWLLGVYWAARVLRLSNNPCVPRSLALFKLLSIEGYAVSFVSGVRRAEGQLSGHAWVELDGLPVDHMRDADSPNLFTENFRYPNALLRQRQARAAAS